MKEKAALFQPRRKLDLVSIYLFGCLSISVNQKNQMVGTNQYETRDSQHPISDRSDYDVNSGDGPIKSRTLDERSFQYGLTFQN